MTWSTSQLRASSVAHDGSESELVCFAFVSLITLGFSSLVFFFFHFPLQLLPCTAKISPLIACLPHILESLRGKGNADVRHGNFSQTSKFGITFRQTRKYRNKLCFNHQTPSSHDKSYSIGGRVMNAPSLRSHTHPPSRFLSPIPPSPFPSPSQPLSHTNVLCLCTSPSPSSISPPLSPAPTRNRLRLQGD